MVSGVCGRHKWQPINKARNKWFERYNRKLAKVREMCYSRECVAKRALESSGIALEAKEDPVEKAKASGIEINKASVQAYAKHNPVEYVQERIIRKKIQEVAQDRVKNFSRKTVVNKSLSDSAIKDIAHTIHDDRVSQEKIAQITKSHLFTNRGSKLENNTIDIINAKLEKINHTVGCAQYFVNGNFKTKKSIVYGVNGMLDGILLDNLGEKRAVIEIKNRISRIMIPAPQYDLDQLAVYLKLTGLPMGILAQQCNGVLDMSVTMTHDDAMARWDDIKPLLDDSVDWYHSVLEDPAGRISMEAFESSPRKSK